MITAIPSLEIRFRSDILPDFGDVSWRATVNFRAIFAEVTIHGEVIWDDEEGGLVWVIGTTMTATKTIEERVKETEMPGVGETD
jgi:hypothetical protein